MKKAIIVFALLLGPMAWMAPAQNITPTNAPGAGNPRPKPPIIAALDTNQDGVISALEIANAATALKTLDKNGDGKLTGDEYIPPRPGGPGGPAGMDGTLGSSQPIDFRNQSSQIRPSGCSGPPPTSDTGDSGKPGPGSGRPPKPLIDTALDANKDGIISADEIANATRILKKLDKNGDAQLTPDEFMPARPKGTSKN